MHEVIRYLSWDQLDLNQQRVMTSAMEQDDLNFVILRWRPRADAVFNHGRNNRGRPYAEALIPAAVELIQAGLVGVATSEPHLHLLDQPEAVSVVENLDNWWRWEALPDVFDPAGPEYRAGDPIETGPWRTKFALDAINPERFRLSGWADPPYMESLWEVS